MNLSKAENKVKASIISSLILFIKVALKMVNQTDRVSYWRMESLQKDNGTMEKISWFIIKDHNDRFTKKLWLIKIKWFLKILSSNKFIAKIF